MAKVNDRDESVVFWYILSEVLERLGKTRMEICELLRVLSQQLSAITQTINDIERTLYNEEEQE